MTKRDFWLYVLATALGTLAAAFVVFVVGTLVGLIPATKTEVLKTLGVLAAGAAVGLLLAGMSSSVSDGDDISLDDAYRKVREKRRRRRRP